MSYIAAGQVHTDEEFDALAKAKGDALKAAAAAQGISLDQVRLTDAQNKAVNAKARAAFKAKEKRRAARRAAGLPPEEEGAAGDDKTLTYVAYVGAAAMVALLVFGRK
jgi:hypothetical protein